MRPDDNRHQDFPTIPQSPRRRLYDNHLTGSWSTAVAAPEPEPEARPPAPESPSLRSVVEVGKAKLADFQDGPKIPRPNMAESFIPVIGPAWEAVGDFQDKNYGGAAFNAAMAIGDALPVGTAIKGVKAASKGIGILKKGSVTAGAAAKAIRRAGLAGAEEEIHHSIPLNGLSRSAQDWRNHYAFLKTLPKETHRRLTGSWARKPRFDPIRRAWHGTTDWQKTVPAAAAAYATDAWENVTHPFHADKGPANNPRR